MLCCQSHGGGVGVALDGVLAKNDVLFCQRSG